MFKYCYALRILEIVGELEKIQGNNYHHIKGSTRDDGLSSKNVHPIKINSPPSPPFPALPSSLPSLRSIHFCITDKNQRKVKPDYQT